MSRDILTGPFRHGLTFIATLAFVISFFGSRLFATLFPSTVLMQGGIHLHHFWYGIALISVAGWMGICRRRSRFAVDLQQLPVRAHIPVFYRSHFFRNNRNTLPPIQGPVTGRTSQTELPRTSCHDRCLPYRFLRFLPFSLVRR